MVVKSSSVSLPHFSLTLPWNCIQLPLIWSQFMMYLPVDGDTTGCHTWAPSFSTGELGATDMPIFGGCIPALSRFPPGGYTGAGIFPQREGVPHDGGGSEAVARGCRGVLPGNSAHRRAVLRRASV